MVTWIDKMRWFKDLRDRNDKYWLKTLIQFLYSKSWREFEELTNILMNDLGFQSVLTKSSHDNGIDVEVLFGRKPFEEKVFIQCKKWKKNVHQKVQSYRKGETKT